MDEQKTINYEELTKLYTLNKEISGLDNKYLKELYKSSVEYNQDKKYTEDEKVIVLGGFSKYLSSLSLFLNDNEFNKKCQNLPVINSTVVSKVEKSISNNKGYMFNQNNKQDDNSNTLINDKEIKEAKCRYIVYEFKSNNNEQSHEENIDFRLNMHNPLKVYLVDPSEKMRKFALEQIVSSVTNVDERRIDKFQKSNESTIKNSNQSDKFLKKEEFEELVALLDKKISQNKVKRMNDKDQQQHNEFMKLFHSLCEQHKMITLEQKIDYYVYLRSSNMFAGNNKEAKKLLKQASSKLKLPQTALQSKTKTQKTAPETRKKLNLIDQPINIDKIDEEGLFLKILKDNYKQLKLNTDFLVPEKHINDIKFRLINFEVNAPIEKMSYQDKLKYIYNYNEINKELLILKDININLFTIYTLLTKNFFTFKGLKYINLCSNNLQDVEISILISVIESTSPGLEHLNISSNRMANKSSICLCKYIEKPSCKLKTLNIDNNSIGDNNFSEFSLGLSKNLYINKLWIAENCLSKVSLIILGTILRYDKKLTLLDLSGNDFTDETIVYIFKGLISNSCLKILIINNSNLGKKSIDILETSLYINNCLKEIYLEGNKINNKCCEILVKILNKNKTLDLISLIGNPIDSDGIDIITENYKLNSKIKYLSKADSNQRKISMLSSNKTELLQYFNGVN